MFHLPLFPSMLGLKVCAATFGRTQAIFSFDATDLSVESFPQGETVVCAFLWVGHAQGGSTDWSPFLIHFAPSLHRASSLPPGACTDRIPKPLLIRAGQCLPERLVFHLLTLFIFCSIIYNCYECFLYFLEK